MIVKRFIDEYEHTYQTARMDQTTDHHNYLKYRQEYIAKLEQVSTADVEDEIFAELKQIAQDPCGEDTNLWINAAYIHRSPKYLPALCVILENEDECIWHEGIVEILYELKDETAIPSLRKALNYDMPYDPSQELAVKILHTLYEINTVEAIQVLEEASNSTSERIQEEASRLLSLRR